MSATTHSPKSPERGGLVVGAATLGKPAASDLVNVMYCAGNLVQDIETYAVFTHAAGECRVVFPPFAAAGAVVLERTSVGMLAAPILVTTSARMVLPV